MKNFSTDIVIIGAGPVGLFAISQIGMQAHLKVHVIDSLDKPGGQPAELYPDKPIYDIPALPVITGQQLTDNLMAQCKPFEPVFHLGEKVETLTRTKVNSLTVTTDAGTMIETKAIIIASGRGLFNPRKPRLDGLDECEGNSVFYAIRRGVREKLQNKNIIIAGGGDSALDWTIALHEHAKSVTLIHRRDAFRAARDTVEKLKFLVSKGSINFLVAEAEKLNHDAGKLRELVIKFPNKERYSIAADMFLPFFGMTPHLGALNEWGMTIERNKIVVDPINAGTNVNGIFAIGDACTYTGKQDLILTGFQEAAHATAGAYKHILNKELRVQFTTSSTDILNALGVEKHVDSMHAIELATPVTKLFDAGVLKPHALA